jgi:hypothetical protein
MWMPGTLTTTNGTLQMTVNNLSGSERNFFVIFGVDKTTRRIRCGFF